MQAMHNVFLTAEWRKLIMANYVINDSVLKPYLPKQLQLDYYHGKCYVSLVGFLFDKVKVKGISIPFHTQFPEVNLRFYVKYFDGKAWKRGVVFISELVPLRAIAWVANTIYGEKYSTLPMHYVWDENGDVQTIKYGWKKDAKDYLISVNADRLGQEMQEGTEEHFIFEHYWGFSKKRNGRTGIYRVDHPSWKTYTVRDFTIHADFFTLYGADFAHLSNQIPDSLFLAEGSAVSIFNGCTLPEQ